MGKYVAKALDRRILGEPFVAGNYKMAYRAAKRDYGDAVVAVEKIDKIIDNGLERKVKKR